MTEATTPNPAAANAAALNAAPAAGSAEALAAAALAAEQETPEAKAAAAALKAEEDKLKTPVPMDGVDDGKGKVSYQPTGNSGLDLALKYVGEQGFAPDHPAMVAAIDGNFDLLAAELAGKGAKGYEAYIKLAENAFGTMRAETLARQKADKEAVEKVAGGAEQWKAASEWAAANADDGEKAAIKAMLSKGGAEAKMAASFIVSNYQRAQGGKETEGAGLKPSEVNGAPAASTNTLTASEYASEVHKARNAHKGRESFESSPAYRDLQDRRRRHRG